jgi:hypothetical protein
MKPQEIERETKVNNLGECSQRTDPKIFNLVFLPVIYYTFTAPPRKPLIINGAGEGNRTLVSKVV